MSCDALCAAVFLGWNGNYDFLSLSSHWSVVRCVTQRQENSQGFAADVGLNIANMFRKWKEAFERKGFKVNLGRAMVLVCGGITKDGLSKGKVDSCGVCNLRVKAA